MNFRPKGGRRGPFAAIDITPLVDVVFILLIFLLVSTTFKTEEQAFSIVLPVGDQKTEVTRVKRPTVYVTREGQYLIYIPDGDNSRPVEGKKLLTLSELSEALGRLVKESGTQTPINIKGDAKADYQQILNVVNESRRHGLERVYFPYKVAEQQE